MTAKTKRDRAAGRQHRHTAIQTIVNNHQGIIDDIASIDNNIAALQERTCDLGNRVDSWYTKLNQANKDALANVAYTMRCVVENERKAAEVEAAVGILQESSKEHQTGIAILNHTSKEHQEAIAQLIAYTNKVHGKQTALNQEINLLQAEMDDTNRRLFQLAWITVGLWAIAALTIFAYLITTH
ncbi:MULTISPECIES: hypothetical protein [unclassified Rothia (in: high G+C Gram-positive bacteria)]|jgi:hypothetical protein|uniref:hypothetical protein n=1 Tax=unclassified Rothia (in: high G+C Gram-positive bacteria) TaxID=2689056 RepID=UPI0008A25180|nr:MULTISPECIES: hypothetical protein [unclassified Rothia (in: high G+C Gram-positive bacteria)]OFM24451.1 hypothetical protein HMPREF2710_05745 [Rothia sp. HMSC069D01]OHP56881.1 hypothetical protein HMPREF2682_03240 [Rothia sp. HMSC061D12]